MPQQFGDEIKNSLNNKTTPSIDEEKSSTNVNATSNSQVDKNKQTYTDNEFKFSVDYPKEWSSKADSRLNEDPDGGIRIYVDGNHENYIYVFGQVGHSSALVYLGLKEEKFETTGGVKGSLFSESVDGKTILHLVMETEDYVGALVYVTPECYSKNGNIIMGVLKSIRINQ